MGPSVLTPRGVFRIKWNTFKTLKITEGARKPVILIVPVTVSYKQLLRAGAMTLVNLTLRSLMTILWFKIDENRFDNLIIDHIL